jgi:hypothetical protein
MSGAAGDVHVPGGGGGGGGAEVTVSAAEPLFPSLVAVICAEPTATAVTSPVPETVATAVLFDAQVTVRPVSVAPFASFSVATACVDWPGETDEAPNDTVTDATGAGGGGAAAVTLSVAEPVWPSLVAMIPAVPTTRPLARPSAVTDATVELADDHVTVRPLSVFPLESFVTATACVL